MITTCWFWCCFSTPFVVLVGEISLPLLHRLKTSRLFGRHFDGDGDDDDVGADGDRDLLW